MTVKHLDGFQKVARTSEIPESHCKLVCVDETQIAIWHVGGRFYAINNICPHQHFPVLYKGALSGLTVTCPMHGWTYSLETGKAISGDGCVHTFEVHIEDDALWIKKE
jgi:nitrite reductase (NADH) small subunit